MAAAEWMVGILELYVLAGAVFAVAFVMAGVQGIDPAAEHAPISFRIVIAPGAAALWPWLLLRWMGRSRP